MKKTIELDEGESVKVGRNTITVKKTGKHSQGRNTCGSATLEIEGPDAGNAAETATDH